MDESIQRQLEHFAPAIGDVVRNDAPQKALKLSQAIRIGAKLGPQCFGGLGFDGNATCALNAAWLAWKRSGVLQEDWMNTYHSVPTHIRHRVLELNDKSRCTREQIADWLEAQGY